MQKRVWICIEKSDANYSAYAPEVLGCIATGDTIEETKAMMTEALRYHLEGMLEDGEPLDAITGDFPSREASEETGERDYWTRVQVDVIPQGSKVGSH